MPLYITLDDVKNRLIGKVRFTTNPADENKMQETLANRLIDEAEGQVELDLSPRYIAPFQTIEGTAFSNLPERPTRNYLRTMCELMAVVRILETDFGYGSAVDSQKYAEQISERYKKMVSFLLERRTDGGQEALGFAKPPLLGLRLNYMNELADDGFMGQVLVTSSGDGDYPHKQINDPSENFWNGRLDD